MTSRRDIQVTPQDLLSFAERRDPEEAYSFCNISNCFLARYAIALGYTNISAGSSFICAKNNAEKIMLRADWLAGSRILCNREGETMGHVARRLRAYIAKQQNHHEGHTHANRS